MRAETQAGNPDPTLQPRVIAGEFGEVFDQVRTAVTRRYPRWSVVEEDDRHGRLVLERAGLLVNQRLVLALTELETGEVEVAGRVEGRGLFAANAVNVLRETLRVLDAVQE